MGLTKELTTVEILEELSDLHKQLTKRLNVLDEKISMYDRMEQDILHLIEGSDSFTSGQSYNYCASLQKIRRARREVKNEKDLLTSIFDSENFIDLLDLDAMYNSLQTYNNLTQKPRFWF